MISRRWSALIVAIFVVIDVTVSALLFVQNTRPDVVPGTTWIRYEFRTSQLDHSMLVLMRVALLIGALLGFCRNPAAAIERINSISLYAVCVCLTLAVYSPLKLLALAETTSDFRLPWFWTLFVWNILASCGCGLIWLFVLCKIDVKNKPSNVSESASLTGNSMLDDRETLIRRANAANSANDDRSGQQRPQQTDQTNGEAKTADCEKANVKTADTAEKDKSLTVVEAKSLIWRLGKYCSYDWPLYVVGFVLLLLASSGDITSRLSADCQSMADTVALNVNILLRNTILMVGTLAFMGKLCWQLTVMTFIAIPLIAVISKVYGRYYERLSKEAQDSLAKSNEVAEEVLGTMRTVRSFANELGECLRFNDMLHGVLKVRWKQASALTGFVWINELFDLILLIVVLWYGGHLVLTTRVRSEDLIAYLLYQLQLGEALINIGYVYTGLMQAVGASRKVFEWIDRCPKISNAGQVVPTDVKGCVEFKNVSFAYPTRSDTSVLKGISFTAKPGEVVALVGPSGGGKSSCISLLEHFYEPTSGQITVDGIQVRDYDHKFYHKMVALVGQEPVLYGRSITENITYGLNSEDWTPEEVTSMSKHANAHDFITNLPHGYETNVGERGVQVSGGQKQRVAIARALMRHPKILLLDEATSALDAESEYLVQQAIYRNLDGHTVILIAHRLSTVEKANKIVVINEGQVVQEGTHDKLLAEEGLYKNLVQRQLLGETIRVEQEKQLSLHNSPTNTPDNVMQR